MSCVWEVVSWMFDGDCRKLDVGRWLLEVLCLMLEAGGCKLCVVTWRLYVGSWRLVVGGWIPYIGRLIAGCWKLEGGSCMCDVVCWMLAA